MSTLYDEDITLAQGGVQVLIPMWLRKDLFKLIHGSDLCPSAPVQPPPPPVPGGVPVGPVPEIIVFNTATTQLKLGGHSLADLVAALQIQVDQHFAPIWGTPVKLTLANGPVAGKWWLGLFDTADVAGALGYHDLTNDGLPLGKCFVKTTQDDGEDIGVTVSHELLEMLGDPAVNLVAFPTVTNKDPVAYETADPVEQDTYQINGLNVSNFVYPEYFQDHMDGKVQTDYLNTLKKKVWPAMTPGGYIAVFVNGQWQQIFGSKDSHERMEWQKSIGHRFGHRSGRRVRLARGEKLQLSKVAL